MNISYEEAVSRCWAEVDLSQLVKNYKNALAHLSASTQLICVLKADAYGLGAPMVARRLIQEGQRYFAVASYDEAAQIKDIMPEAHVLILGLCSERQIEKAIRRRMAFTVFSEHYGRMIGEMATRLNIITDVHFKIETGLNRLGMNPATAAGKIEQLLMEYPLSAEGLFTHLALRDKDSDRRQIDLLTGVRDELTARGIVVTMTHALDSIGMVRYPQDHLDAVRTGAWLYGVYPRGYAHPEESQLAMTVKTRIAQLHHVKAGECLGYDETHPIARDSVIATLSCGYIDGYPRLNNVGFVEIRGQRAPVAGLVCMDQMMVDVTDIPDAAEGDEVTLLGGGIGVDEYASVAGLNRNESLARTGKRVPRVYMEDGRVISCVLPLE